MRLPLRVDGHDVIVRADGPVDVATATAAVTGARPRGVAVVDSARRRRIDVGGDALLDAAGIRPGDELYTVAAPPWRPDHCGWVVDVVAGVDAGRTIPIAADRGAVAVTVGRGAEAMVRLASPGVSLHHCTIVVAADSITVTDGGSRNGTVVAGRRVGPAAVAVEPGALIRCGPAAIRVRPAPPADTPAKVAELLHVSASGAVPFYRPPVDLPPGPPAPIELPAGPRRPRSGRPSLLAVALPLAMAVVMVRLTGNLVYGLFALMGPLMMLVSTADRASRNRKIRQRSRRRFRREMTDLRRELIETFTAELRRRSRMHPDVAELARCAAVAGAALWTRRRNHPHFLDVLVGYGDLPWEPPFAGSPAEHPELERLVDDASVLRGAPLAVSLAPGSVLGLAGSRPAALATARAVIAQVATLHGPAEVRVAVVCAVADAADWDWVKWLPHVRPAFAGGRLLTVVADGRVDGAAIDEVLADVEGGAMLVAVVDTAGLADAGDLAVRRALGRGDAATSAVIVAPAVDGLPDRCTVVVDHHEALGEATCRWPGDGGRTQEVVAAGIPPGVATEVARSLARLTDPDAGGGSASLPQSVGHADVLGLRDARPGDVGRRWQASVGRCPLPAVVGSGADGPVTVDLAADGPHLAVIGARGSGKTEQLGAIVLSLAAGLAPEALHVVLWGESFTHLQRLPHVASSVSRIDDAAVSFVLEGLERELARRERARTADGAAGAGGSVRLVVVVDDADTVTRAVPAAGERLVRLLRRSRGLGVHVVFSASRHQGGPIADLVDLATIRVVQRVASPPDSVDLIGSEVAARLERSLPGRGFVVAGRGDPIEVQAGAVSVGAPRPSGALDVEPFSLATGRARPRHTIGPPDERALVALVAAAGAASARPADLLSPAVAAAEVLESPGLLELLGIDGLNPAVDAVTERWHTLDSEAMLRVPIGVDPEMRPVLLDVKESALAGMGPHGLLVGATGSGKSELLRTLVCGLALTHSPEALAFVLVDFKGGASFASLGRLPHVAGVVTNLADDLALVDRILAALGGEQRRRQELLAEAGNLANAREYRARRAAGALPAHLADEPLPELLVVVDEFAELLDQEPAFIDFFLTIGRVGRSLGIHLLLASQRLEEGKLRGLDTYLSYRLGLRTFSAAESRMVLGVPDAYSLPAAPGGGYLKVGTTSFQRFQASYVSGLQPGGASVLEAIIERLEAAAPRAHQIWLPPLDDALTLDALFDGGFVHDPRRGFAAARWPGTAALAVPVGVVDEPARQRTLPLILDFAGAHGNLAVAGAPQSGKSVLLRTMVLSLAVTHTADEVQVHALDFGGGTLASLAGLPHVGTVASRLEPELVRRLVDHMESLLTERETMFGRCNIDGAATLRQRRADGELAPGEGADVFLIIDGWAAFRERFEELEPVIADLAARGLGYGIHVVVTANRWMEVRAPVLDAIGGRLELRLNAALDSAVDRRRAATIRPSTPGRGLHPSTLLFQLALPRLDGQPSTDRLNEATGVAVEHITRRWSGRSAEPVRLLPTAVTIGDIVEAHGVGGDAADAGVLVGLAERGMAPWRFDLGGSEPHFMVFGDGESGKTTFLQTWLRGMTAAAAPQRAQVVLVDYRRTLLDVVPSSHLRAYAASEPAANDVIQAVVADVAARLPGADVTAAQLRARSWWDGPELYVVVDDYDLVVTPSGNPLSPLLPYLAQGRDVGLHVVLARRVAGAAKMMYEPVTARIREVSPNGLILAGERDEGPLLGTTRASPQPPGRGVLVTRRAQPTLVQVALTDTLVDA
jgi:S-DNA-T family DNA segregation ATPase FtsK/SpoIIIE